MNALLLAVDVPPISHVTIWGSGPLGFNKTAAIYLFATLATILVFALGTRRKEALVPSGLLQNTAESGVGFVRNQIIMQTMGTDGLRYLPYLTALFALKPTVVIMPFSFALLVAMTGFEILVSFLQAFIFTILTAVYIDSSMHPSH